MDALINISHELEDKNERYSDLLYYARNQFLAEKKHFNYQYVLDKHFSFNQKEKVFEIDNKILNKLGSLTSLSAPSTPEKEFEMLNALELSPLFEQAKKLFPKSPWVYYTSSDFIYIYPNVLSKDFKFSKEINDTEFYKNCLPENNKERKIIWTNPYFDLAGQGMMITKSLPVDIGGKMLGTLSLDVTLSDIREGLNLWYFQLGNLYVVNENGILIASNNQSLNNLKTMKQIYNNNILQAFNKSNYFINLQGKKFFYKRLEKNNFFVSYEIPSFVYYSHIFSRQFISFIAFVIFSLFFIWWWLEEKMQLQFEADNIYKNKLISLAEMSGGIAHEINNPLTVIQGRAAQTIKKMARSEMASEDIKNNLEKIIFSADRISKIITALKHFSRNDSTQEMQATKLSDLISDTLFLCENRIHNDDSKLEVDTIPNVKIKCHGYQIIQILINLINNSYDATASLEVKWIRISFYKEEGYIKINITDSGNGIDPAIQEKIFEPFYTTKPINYGTGLGLSISKKIALNHRGDLSIDQHSPNTRFVLKLPVFEENN